MVLEIIAGVIALAFVILVVFLILTLQDSRKAIKKADRVLSDIHKTLGITTEAGLHILDNVNKLTSDVRKKSEALDVIFRPLYALRKHHSNDHNNFEKAADVIECVTNGFRLFNQIKDEIKSYVKSRK